MSTIQPVSGSAAVPAARAGALADPPPEAGYNYYQRRLRAGGQDREPSVALARRWTVHFVVSRYRAQRRKRAFHSLKTRQRQAFKPFGPPSGRILTLPPKWAFAGGAPVSDPAVPAPGRAMLPGRRRGRPG